MHDMRALIRGTEICLENAWTKWQRMNLLFLTGKEKDYQEPMEDTEEPQPVQSTPSKS